MRRPVRTIAARCAWAAILFVICFSGTFGAGDAISAGDNLSNDEQALMDEYYQAARNGNYPAAWSCVERMFAPAEHSRTHRLLDHCRNDRDNCPEVDFIAWVLGKAKSDLSFMDWFCPEEAPEEECRYWKDWRSDIRAHLGDAPSPPTPMAHELGFLFPWADVGDLRLEAMVWSGGKALRAGFDTAAHRVEISEQSALFATTAYARLAETQEEYDEAIESYRVKGELVLRDLYLGSVAERRVPAVSEDYSDDDIWLGMPIFLRHGQACFSWPEQMLRLGHLGPCSQGETPFKGAAELRAGTLPFIQIPGAEGELLRILVGTGYPRTLCTDRFVRQMGGKRFRFGEHPALEAECVEDYSPQPVAEGSEIYLHAVLGMDALIKFQAFGWELNPFRMYFVPKHAQKQGAQ